MSYPVDSFSGLIASNRLIFKILFNIEMTRDWSKIIPATMYLLFNSPMASVEEFTWTFEHGLITELYEELKTQNFLLLR